MKLASIFRITIGLLLMVGLTACGGGGGGNSDNNNNAEWDGSNWDQTNWQ